MRYASFFVLGAVVAAPCLAADRLAIGPRPSWVSEQTLQVDQRPAADSPVELLLLDSQHKLDPDFGASYSHYAFRINSAQGLAGTNVSAEWNPAFDEVTVHQVTIRRGGQRIDLLGDGKKFTILRREQNLEQQTLNGQLTATLQPDGLQIGDILEVEMTAVRRDPTLRGHMEVNAALNLPTRANQVRIRLLWPAASPTRRRTYRGIGEGVVSRSGRDTVTSWAFSPFLPVQAPRNAPPRFAQGMSVDVTDFASWADLSALLLPHFEKASAIPADSPLQAEIARIKAASPDPAKRAQLALELVQGKIRYVNLALGTGGLVPAGADLTWQRRYGDCKGKTVLLIGLLRALGVAAEPVLVSSNGDGLNERLPMVGLFDHVLVKATIGNKPYWLDGTRSGDGRLDLIRVPAFRWGLPLVRNAQLERIMPGPLTIPGFETIIHTDASAGVDKPVPTTLEFIFRGDNAIAQNLIMSALDPALRNTAQRDQLRSQLDRFDVEKVESSFDPDALVYRLRGEGRQTLDIGSSDGTYWSEVPSLGYKADFKRTEGRDQDAPVEIGYPFFTRKMQTIVLPKMRAQRITFQTPPTAVTAAGVEYRRTVTNAGGVVTIDNQSRSLVPEISHAEAMAAENKLRELNDSRIWIRLSDARPSAQDVQALIGKEPKSWSDYQQAAIKFMSAKEPLKALAMLDRAVELAPGEIQLLMFRAQVRSGDGDSKGALADAEKYLQKNPRDGTMRQLHAVLSLDAGNKAAALADAKALEPVDNATAQVARGRILNMLGSFSEAVVAFKAALKFENDPLTHVMIAEVLPPGDKTARRAALDAALALNPVDSTSLLQAAQIALELGDPARALGLLDQAFLKSPDDIQVRHLRAVAMALAGKAQAAEREFDALGARDLSASELNSLCWGKATANAALDRALRECDRSLALEESRATRDSKGMVLLRLGRWDDSIREYDAALENDDRPYSLYGRAIAFARKGDRARSDADAARALNLSPSIERIYGYFGLTR